MEIVNPIKRELDLADIAYQRIKEMILETTLKPGETIYAPQLARAFEVSRTPVREALVRLKQEGWILPAEAQGYLVSPLTPEDLHNLFEMRLLLEPPAIGLFVELASKQLIDDLCAPIEEIETQIQSGDFELYFETHMKLHDAYIQHCPNKLLRESLIHINELMYRLRAFTRIEPTLHVKEAFEEQKRILMALQAQDAKEAQQALAQHIEAAEKRVVAQLETNGFSKLISEEDKQSTK